MTRETVLRGRSRVFGDYVDAYQLLPQVYWKGKRLSVEELGKHAMEGADPTFAGKALAGEYSIIVAGHNFGGGGKSLEEPILALKAAGVKAILADSCSRYFFRNAINNGMAVMMCEGISKKVKTGDEIEVNLSKGEIQNLSTGIRLHTDPMPEIVLEILNRGGYIPYTKNKLAMQKASLR